MDKRTQLLEGVYGDGREDTRLTRSRHGQLEFLTTMSYIGRQAPHPCRVL